MHLKYLDEITKTDFSKIVNEKQSSNIIGKTNLFSSNDSTGWKGLDEVRQNKFNDALYKFGWKSMYSWRYNNKLLNHTKHLTGHNHHLHIQEFKPTLKKIK